MKRQQFKMRQDNIVNHILSPRRTDLGNLGLAMREAAHKTEAKGR